MGLKLKIAMGEELEKFSWAPDLGAWLGVPAS